jgi:hypothetical protein
MSSASILPVAAFIIDKIRDRQLISDQSLNQIISQISVRRPSNQIFRGQDQSPMHDVFFVAISVNHIVVFFYLLHTVGFALAS